jgi:hypothetical protein
MATVKKKGGNMSSYQQRFRAGWVPENLALEGKFPVYMVAPFLPKVRFFRQNKVFDKKGASISGVNEFLGLLRVAKFRVEKGKSLSDPDLDVIRIVYDDPTNPAIVRPLVDEVRQVGKDEYLGQGMYQVFGKAVWAFWFLVKR